MKRNIIQFMVIGAMVTAMLASCNKNKETEANVPENGFRATIEQMGGNGSRTHIAPESWAVGANTEVLWSEGDQIVVRNGNDDAATYTLTDGEGTTSGTFYSGEGGGDFFQPSYTAIYPAAEGNTVTGEGTATFTLPATQSYVANSFANGAMPMMAVSDDQTLAFKNVLGGICFPLVGDGLTVTRVELTSATDEALWGTCTTTISTTGGDPTSTVANGETGKNRLTLDCSATPVTLDATTPTYFCFMVPPESLANGFTVTVYDEETQLDEKTTTANPSITRSVISKPNSSLEIPCPCSLWPAGFTVGMDGDTPRRVYFAPGNLQWSATNGGTTATTHAVAGGGTAAGTWRFASNQWDYIGNATQGTIYGVGGNSGTKCDNSQISSSYQGWIDHFGWGTSGWNNGNYFYQPYSSSNSTSSPYTQSNGYGYGPKHGSSYTYSLTGAYANADWGVYNAIYNPKTNITDPAGTWRTPTKDEWVYVLNTRSTCSGVRFAMATVNNVPGLIIVPDNWDVNTYALNSTNTAGAAFTVNTISSTDWTNIFEPAGCAFLPAAGYRFGSSVGNVGTYGRYYSATYDNSSNAYLLAFSSGIVEPSGSNFRYLGRTVRLVRPAE